MKILIILAFQYVVSGDLIGWNRQRNNEHQRKFCADDISSQIIDQIQEFYSRQGKNGQFLKARRSLIHDSKLRKFHRKLHDWIKKFEIHIKIIFIVMMWPSLNLRLQKEHIVPKEKQLVSTIFECHTLQQLVRFHFRFTTGLFRWTSGTQTFNIITWNETVHLIGAYNDLYFDFIKWGSSIALYVFGLSLSSASKSSSALVVGPFPYGLNLPNSHPKMTMLRTYQ